MRPDSCPKVYNLNFFDRAIEGFADMSHELVKLSGYIDWHRIEKALEGHYCRYGRKAIPTRMLVGLQMLRWMYNLSDEAVCALWVENPYFQYFCGQKLFQYKLPMDRSSMTRWRKRIGGEKLQELLIESLEAAKRAGALREKDMERVAVDTTVQEKAVDHPSEIKLTHDAIIDLAREARKAGLKLKQNYRFMAKALLRKASGYAHARQFNRLRTAKKQMSRLLVKLHQRLEHATKKSGMTELPPALAEKIARSTGVLLQEHLGGKKLLVWHAPEVECIGKGKARTPFEFGCKVSLTTNINPAKGGHFILSAQALHGKPYDGHTLATAINSTQHATGVEVRRVYVDKGYKGHDYEHKARVFISGQKRGVHGQIKRELKRRSAVEPIIGHAKHGHGLARHRLKGEAGDRVNALFAAIGFNLRQVLNFIKKFWYAWIMAAFILGFLPKNRPNPLPNL
jgi:transposase, IS5 family